MYQASLVLTGGQTVEIESQNLSYIILEEWLFRSKNFATAAVFGRKDAARPQKDKLHPTLIPPKKDQMTKMLNLHHTEFGRSNF